jgi:hypothetical protein
VLLLIDLDNTLIDRTGAFKSWAAEYVPEHGGDAADLAWIIAADRDGYEPRERLAARLGDRFGVDHDRMLTELRAGVVTYTVLDPAVGRSLRDAVAAGFEPVVVTNGTVRRRRWRRGRPRHSVDRPRNAVAAVAHPGADQDRRRLPGRRRADQPTSTTVNLLTWCTITPCVDPRS